MLPVSKTARRIVSRSFSSLPPPLSHRPSPPDAVLYGRVRPNLQGLPRLRGDEGPPRRDPGEPAALPLTPANSCGRRTRTFGLMNLCPPHGGAAAQDAIGDLRDLEVCAEHALERGAQDARSAPPRPAPPLVRPASSRQRRGPGEGISSRLPPSWSAAATAPAGPRGPVAALRRSQGGVGQARQKQCVLRLLVFPPPPLCSPLRGALTSAAAALLLVAALPQKAGTRSAASR